MGTVFETSEADPLAFRDFSNQENLEEDVYDPDAAIRDHVGSSSPLSLDYYSKYFDVDIHTVLDRSWRPLNPLTSDYLSDVLLGQPDLYGPFWLPTTLILVLFLSASLASSVNAYLAGQPYSYDFSRLTVAVSTVYIYALAVPLLLWAGMRYWAQIPDRSPVELVSIYGYGMVAWIPAALLSIAPVEILRIIVTALSFTSSLYFLVRNIYPPLASSAAQSSRLLILLVAILHVGLTATFWIAFLGVGAGVNSDPPASSPSPA